MCSQEGLNWNVLIVISAAFAVVAYFTYTEIINPPRHLRKMLPPITGLNIDRVSFFMVLFLLSSVLAGYAEVRVPI